MEGIWRGYGGCDPHVAIFDHLSVVAFRENDKKAPAKVPSRSSHGAQNLDRTTHSSRKPAVNLNLGEPFCSVLRLHMLSWLSAARRRAARDARVWKNTPAKRRR